MISTTQTFAACQLRSQSISGCADQHFEVENRDELEDSAATSVEQVDSGAADFRRRQELIEQSFADYWSM